MEIKTKKKKKKKKRGKLDLTCIIKMNKSPKPNVDFKKTKSRAPG